MIKHKAAIQFGIIGLGRFGRALTKTLADARKEILAVDMMESRVKQVKPFTDSAAIVADYEKESLEDCGIQNCETVIICIGDSIDIGVLTTLNVLSLEVPRVIARAMSAEQGMILEKIGAEVMYPENDMAVRLANKLINSSIMETIKLRGDVAITELRLTSKIANQTIQQINLRQKYNLNIIALEQGGETTTEISPDYSLNEGDGIVVIGKQSNIEKLEEFLTK